MTASASQGGGDRGARGRQDLRQATAGHADACGQVQAHRAQHDPTTIRSPSPPATSPAQGAPKVGNLAFIGEYSWRLGARTYAWWNGVDNIPALPPQVRGLLRVVGGQLTLGFSRRLTARTCARGDCRDSNPRAGLPPHVLAAVRNLTAACAAGRRPVGRLRALLGAPVPYRCTPPALCVPHLAPPLSAACAVVSISAPPHCRRLAPHTSPRANPRRRTCKLHRAPIPVVAP